MAKKGQDNFFSRVHSLVRKVPYGRVTTYGTIGRYLGAGKSARMVGWALNQSHSVSPPVPAHRVVNRNGQLTGKGHFASPEMMEELLLNEGVRVENDAVCNFENLLWDPSENL